MGCEDRIGGIWIYIYIYNQVCYPRFVVVVVVVKRFTGDYNMAELFFLVS